MLTSQTCLPLRPRKISAKFFQTLGLAFLLCFASAISASAQTTVFLPTGAMVTNRTEHTATLLSNGTVLIAGGLTYSAATPVTTSTLASAELYDATTLAFAATGNMTVARSAHTATLLSNGKVLIAGGVDANGNTQASAELYDLTSGTFTATGSMTIGRSSHTADLLSNGKVLISGGVDPSGNPEASAELYDPASGTFAATGAMTTPRYSHTATVLSNGKVLIAGGENSGATQLASAELYDPSTGMFTATGNMTDPRYSHTATLLNTGKVLVAGGWGVSTMGNCEESPVWNTAELYDPTSGTFTLTGTMNSPRYLHTATLLNNNLVLLVAGNMGPTFNPDCGVEYPPMLAGSELFDPSTGAFAPSANMSPGIFPDVDRDNHTANLLQDGTVLVAGGTSTNGFAVPSAMLYETEFASVNPEILSFGSQGVGIIRTDWSLPLSVLNTGSAPLNITQITFNGVNPSDFLETDNCVGSLAVGAQCTIQVKFAPSAVGLRSANVVIVNNNNLAGAIKVPVNGTGTPVTAPTATVMVSPTSLSFSSQYVGTSGLPQTVTVSNIGSAPVTIGAVSSSSADFGVLNNCVNPLPVQGNCTVGVFFDPTAGGARTGTITFNDNSPTGFQTVSLTGTGEDFSMAASSGGGSSATVSAGQTATYSVALAPAGGFAQSVNLSCSGGPAMSTCSVSPSMVALSGTGTKTVTVSVATSAQGLVPSLWSTWRRNSGPRTPLVLAQFAMLLAMLFALSMWSRARRWRLAPAFAVAALLCVAMSLAACGGSGSSPTQTSNSESGTYTITVTGNFASGSANVKHTTNLTLVVH